MMLARFFAGSIRRQIALLAIGPVLLFAILGTVSEHLTIKEPESVSQARSVAMRSIMTDPSHRGIRSASFWVHLAFDTTWGRFPFAQDAGARAGLNSNILILLI